MIPPLLLRVRQFAARHALWRPDTRVIVAVSGGSDSVALLVLLHELHARNEVRLDAVAHFNHGLRGQAADQDEAFCRDLAASRTLPFVRSRDDIAARARRQKTSVEVAGREARRAFLDEVRRARTADAIATAHTADDQAETVLLRLVRGTGLRGLGGITPQRGPFVRPLLDCSREDLRDHLRTIGQTWREDESNADLANPRNRVRHELLPYLERHFNPLTVSALTRLAEVARGDEDLLDRAASAVAVDLVRRSGDQTLVDARRLNLLPEALARRVVQQAIEVAGAGRAGLAEVDRVRAVADASRGAGEIAGLRVELSGAFVVLMIRGGAQRSDARFRFDVPIPGVAPWPVGGWTLEVEGPITRQPGPCGLKSPDQVEIESEGLGATLVVRSREPGDRIRPLGLGGSKKVQDVLVDRKVGRDERDSVPIVTDQSGRLIWVAGHVLAEDFRVTTRTNAVVILKLRRY